MSEAFATIEVRGVLFDMDGVLVSSIAGVERSWRRWAAHYNLPHADQFTIPHGTRAIEIVRRFKPDIDPEEGLRVIDDIEVADTADIKVLPGVRDLLANLPADRWTIVTSATGRLLRARLAAADLPVPQQLVSAETVSAGKPDPEPYRRGAELLGLATGDCLVVEDAPSGVRSGVAAGCRVLGVEGTHTAAELRAEGVAWVVPSLAGVRVQSAGNNLRLELSC